jgi:PmbA protein
MSIASFILRKGLGLGADELAVLLTSSTCRQVRFANNQVTISNEWVESVARILFKKAGKLLMSSTNDLSRDSLTRFMGKLNSLVELAKPHPHYTKLPGAISPKRVAKLHDPRLIELKEECIQVVRTAIESAMEEGAKRVAGSLWLRDSLVRLTTSTGIDATYRKSVATLEVRALANKEASGLGVCCGTSIEDLNSRDAGTEAGRIAKMSVDARRGKAGKHDVVFGRPAAAVLFSSVGSMCSAFHVDSGYSCFAGKLGKEVASKTLNLWDDGRLRGGIGSRPFDDEGYATRKTTLIKGGVLKGFLHNTLTANKHKTRTTANAGWLVPRPWNLIVGKGRLSKEELFREVRNGLYVHNLGYVRFQDHLRGDFSAVLRDGVFEIRDGELGRAVRGLRLSENLIELLRSIRALSRKRVQTHHWWVETGVPVVTPLVCASDVGFTEARQLQSS